MSPKAKTALKSYQTALKKAKKDGKKSFEHNGRKYSKHGEKNIYKCVENCRKKSSRKTSKRKSAGKKCKETMISRPKGTRCRPGPKTPCKNGGVRRKVSKGKRKGKYDCVLRKKSSRRKSSKRKKSARKAKGFLGDMRRNKSEDLQGLAAFGIAGGRKRRRH